MTSTIVIGTRGSELATRQTAQVTNALIARFPHIETTVKVIRSESDRRSRTPLSALGRGMFTKTLEDALLDRRIDLAVHSLKDLPTEPVPGLMILPVLQRADPRDALINRWGLPLSELPAGARIGTSSPRREAQLHHLRPDIEFLPIRGNVETRVAKALGRDYDGVVVAAAGIERLGLQVQIAEYLSPQVSTPAPGQGALAVEVRSQDASLLEIMHALQHKETAAAVEAERWVLRAAGSGCQVPIGALAVIEETHLQLTAACASDDGTAIFRTELSWPTNDPEGAGRAAYQRLLNLGAGAVTGAKEPV